MALMSHTVKSVHLILLDEAGQVLASSVVLKVHPQSMVSGAAPAGWVIVLLEAEHVESGDNESNSGRTLRRPLQTSLYLFLHSISVSR
jgi:hypothetical protein